MAASAGNYTCIPYNSVNERAYDSGKSLDAKDIYEKGATVYIEVHAPPTFVQSLPKYSGKTKKTKANIQEEKSSPVSNQISRFSCLK